jgi:hypothetical protein
MHETRLRFGALAAQGFFSGAAGALHFNAVTLWRIEARKGHVWALVIMVLLDNDRLAVGAVEDRVRRGDARLLGFAALRFNIWVILAALLALLVVARYMQHQETPRICVDDPTASVCHR